MFAWFDFVMVYIYSISPFLPLLLSLAFIFPGGGSPLSVPHALLCPTVPLFSMLFFGITFLILLCHTPLYLTLRYLFHAPFSLSVSPFPPYFTVLSRPHVQYLSLFQSVLSHSFPLLHIPPALLSASHFLNVSISASQFLFPCPWFFSHVWCLWMSPLTACRSPTVKERTPISGVPLVCIYISGVVICCVCKK